MISETEAPGPIPRPGRRNSSGARRMFTIIRNCQSRSNLRCTASGPSLSYSTGTGCQWLATWLRFGPAWARPTVQCVTGKALAVASEKRASRKESHNRRMSLKNLKELQPLRQHRWRHACSAPVRAASSLAATQTPPHDTRSPHRRNPLHLAIKTVRRHGGLCVHPPCLACGAACRFLHSRSHQSQCARPHRQTLPLPPRRRWHGSSHC